LGHAIFTMNIEYIIYWYLPSTISIHLEKIILWVKLESNYDHQRESKKPFLQALKPHLSFQRKYCKFCIFSCDKFN
jgi:hypothetical protein